MCKFDGYLTAFCMVTIVSYAFCLAHSMLEMIQNFQHSKKYTAGVKYHIMSNGFGIGYCILVGILGDAGPGVMGTCAMEYGSISELIIAPLMIYATLYIGYSILVVIQKIIKDRSTINKEQTTFYVLHIVNELMVIISQILCGFSHSSTFLFQLWVHDINQTYIKLLTEDSISIKNQVKIQNQSLFDSEFQLRDPFSISKQRNKMQSKISNNHQNVKNQQVDKPLFVYLQEENSIKNLVIMFHSISTHFEQLKLKRGDLKKYLTNHINKISRKIGISLDNIKNRQLSEFQSSVIDKTQESGQITPNQVSEVYQNQNMVNSMESKQSLGYALNKSSMKSQSKPSMNVKFEEYHPVHFQNIREISKVTFDQLISSFSTLIKHKIFQRNFDAKVAGRSGKNIIMTKDKRFLVKEIDSDEKHNLLKFSEIYSEYILGNQRTTLAKIYGLFSLKLPGINKVYFIIMQNLDYYSDNTVIFRYDLKFSQVNRRQIESHSDIQFLHEYLLSKDQAFEEILGDPENLYFKNIGNKRSKQGSQISVRDRKHSDKTSERNFQIEKGGSKYIKRSEDFSNLLGNQAKRDSLAATSSKY
eukprot:403372578